MERNWRERMGPPVRVALTPTDRWSIRVWQAIESGPEKLRSTLANQDIVDSELRRLLDTGFNPIVVAAAALSVDGWDTDKPTISTERLDIVKKKFRALHDDPAYCMFDVLVVARLLTQGADNLSTPGRSV